MLVTWPYSLLDIFNLNHCWCNRPTYSNVCIFRLTESSQTYETVRKDSKSKFNLHISSINFVLIIYDCDSILYCMIKVWCFLGLIVFWSAGIAGPAMGGRHCNALCAKDRGRCTTKWRITSWKGSFFPPDTVCLFSWLWHVTCDLWPCDPLDLFFKF